jgi:preprotein translocase subunit SecY
MTVITLTTGTAFIMWLGEQISERGIGNGISLIIFAGIVVGLVPAIGTTIDSVQRGNLQFYTLIPLIIFMVLVVAFIVYMERAQRRIPVQYAKRVVGRRVYGGQSTYLPLRVNTGGVIPVIFASSVVTIPTAGFSAEGPGWVQTIAAQLAHGQPLYMALYAFLIIFFAYFYTAIIFNPDDVAENMRKYGGFIPGIRPGKRTAEYIDTILTRITLVGAIYLAAVTVLPEFLLTGIHVAGLPWLGPRIAGYFPSWFTEGMGIQFYFGGTSLLIVVGVAMDTIQQIESQLVMRNYEGFMKRGRIRGRRG